MADFAAQEKETAPHAQGAVSPQRPSFFMRNGKLEWLFCLLLAGLVFGVYFQTGRFGFINFDDPAYVFQNPHVIKGLTWEGFKHAFALKGVAYWHPLAVLSHMLDVTLFGLAPGKHHLASVFFHTLNVILLFGLMIRLSGRIGRSLLIAAIFAAHPINADSVAWIAERKSLLSALFFLASVYFYALYATRPSVARYLAVFVSMALSLLAKPLAVTLPAVLLALDFWPLGRIRGAGPGTANPAMKGLVPTFGPGRIIAEKLPLVALSAASVGLTLFSASIFGDIAVSDRPFSLRLANALYSYAIGYPANLAWPFGLSIFYPYPVSMAWWKTALSALLVMGAWALAVFNIKKRPFIAVGLFWYFAVMFPMSGLKQAGLWPALADRFAYVPQIGLLMVLAWALAEAGLRLKIKPVVQAVPTAFLVAALAFAGWRQAATFRNGEILFSRAVAVTENNYVAENNLGHALLEKGKTGEALARFLAALKYNPDYADAMNNAAAALMAENRHGEAIPYLKRLVAGRPGHATGLVNLAVCLKYTGRNGEASIAAARAGEAAPEYAEGFRTLGEAWLKAGDSDGAEAFFKRAITLNPASPKAYAGLAEVFRIRGDNTKARKLDEMATGFTGGSFDSLMKKADEAAMSENWPEAADAYKKALALDPGSVRALTNLAVACAALGRKEEAVIYIREARRVDPGNPRIARLEEALGILP